jgi:hypothetical protein
MWYTLDVYKGYYQTSNATIRDRSTPDIGNLTLESAKGSRQASPPSGKKQPYQTTPEPSSEWSAEVTNSSHFQSSQPQSPARQQPQRTVPKPQHSQRQQPGLIELQRYDPRYPGLFPQPDSRPISQEQLVSEAESIYTGLTMVETKCIHVDRAQAAASQDHPNTKLTSHHWQALIALHRTLLHEHHDFFLASQHPSVGS